MKDHVHQNPGYPGGTQSTRFYILIPAIRDRVNTGLEKTKKIYSDRKKLESGSAMFWLSGIWIEKIKCNYKILDPNRGSIIPQSIMYTKLVSNNL